MEWLLLAAGPSFCAFGRSGGLHSTWDPEDFTSEIREGTSTCQDCQGSTGLEGVQIVV